jgi:uncharacterized membrane protein YedE/YeeE
MFGGNASARARVLPPGRKWLLAALGETEEGTGMTTEFTPFESLAGGVLIGLAAVLLMALNGRIAGMTMMIGAVLTPRAEDTPWRLAFLAGAVVSPALATLIGADFAFGEPTTGWLLILGGVIVGVGVSLGSGCTSGHGVCGIARLSPRSIVATLAFMATTFATVTLMRHGFGG